MADRLEEGPLADELLELQEARRATDDLQKWGGDPREFLDAQRYAEACEERFWSEAFKNPGRRSARAFKGWHGTWPLVETRATPRSTGGCCNYCSQTVLASKCCSSHLWISNVMFEPSEMNASQTACACYKWTSSGTLFSHSGVNSTEHGMFDHI